MSSDRLDVKPLTMIHYECYKERKDGFITCAETETAISATQDVNVKKKSKFKRLAIKTVFDLKFF